MKPLEIDGYHLVEALLCHLFEQQELAVTCIDKTPWANSSLIVANIVSRSVRLLTSARRRDFRLQACP